MCTRCTCTCTGTRTRPRPSQSTNSNARTQTLQLAVQEVRGAEPYHCEPVVQVPVPDSHADDRAVNPFTKRKSIVVNCVRLFIYNSCLFTRGLVKLCLNTRTLGWRIYLHVCSFRHNCVFPISSIKFSMCDHFVMTKRTHSRETLVYLGNLTKLNSGFFFDVRVQPPTTHLWGILTHSPGTKDQYISGFADATHTHECTCTHYDLTELTDEYTR